MAKLLQTIVIQRQFGIGRIEDVGIVSVAAFLATILPASFPNSFHIVSETGVVSEVDVSSPIGISVVLESAFRIFWIRLANGLVGRPDRAGNGIPLCVVGSHCVAQCGVGSIGILLFGLRKNSRPVDGEILGEMVSALQIGGKNALRGRGRSHLVILRITVFADIFSTDAIAVSDTFGVGMHIHIIPFQLVTRHSQVQFGMNTRIQIVDAVVAVLQLGNIHGLFARSHLYRIISALSPPEGVLYATCNYHAQAVFPEAIAYADATNEVGTWSGVTL